MRWLFIIPFFTLAWSLLSLATNIRSAYHRLILTFSSGLGLTVSATALLGHATHDLRLALGFGSGFCLLLTLFLFRKVKTVPTDFTFRFSWGLLPVILWCAFSLVMISRIAWNFDFHDQLGAQGHAGLVESMVRGNLPPSLIVFPQIPLKYHYGADLMAAVFSDVTGWSGLRGIDLTMIVGWAALLTSLYVLCREIGMNHGFCFLALLWAPLAAGWVYLLKPWLDLPEALVPVDFNWPDNYVVFKRWLNPGVISYFFQTPYSLGLPLFFCYLAIFWDWIKNRNVPALLLAAFILGSLSVVQVTLFLTSLACTLLVLGSQVLFEKISLKNTLRDILCFSAIVLTLTFSLGGFFVVSNQYSGQLLEFGWPPGYLRYARHFNPASVTSLQAVLWYFSNFGSLCLLLLPILFLAIWALRKKYQPLILFLLCFSLLSFALPQFFYYRLSWDIIKWFTTFQLGITLLILLLISRPPLPKIGLIVVLPFLILDIVPSLRFLYGLSFRKPGDFQGNQKKWWGVYAPEPPPQTKFLAGIIKSSPWHEVLLTPEHPFPGFFSRYTGQSIARPDFNTVAFGVRGDILQERNRAIETLLKDFSLEVMGKSHIRWIVYPCKKFEETFSEISKEKITEAVRGKKLEEIAFSEDSECWKVYHLPAISSKQ